MMLMYELSQMPELLYFCLFAGAFVGGFINGLAGFGTALFALGWWLQVMDPRAAVALVLAVTVLVGAQGLYETWTAINWGRLARFVLPAFLGIPLGVMALAYVNATQLSLLVGVLLVVYGGYFAFRRNLPLITGRLRGVDVGLGFAGGVLGAMAGLSGVLPSMWSAMRPWTKTEQRAVLQAYNMIVIGSSIPMLAINGAYDRAVLADLALVLPVSVLGAFCGIRLFRRLSDNAYRRLVIILMLLSGVGLLSRTLLFNG